MVDNEKWIGEIVAIELHQDIIEKLEAILCYLDENKLGLAAIHVDTAINCIRNHDYTVEVRKDN